MHNMSPPKPNSGNLWRSLFFQLVWMSDQEAFTVGDLAAAFQVHKNTVRKSVKHLEAIEALECVQPPDASLHSYGIWRTTFRLVERVDQDDRCGHGLIRAYCDFCKRRLKWLVGL